MNAATGTLGPAERTLLFALCDPRRRTPGLAGARLDWAALVRAAARVKLLPVLAQRAFAEGVRFEDAALEARLREALLEAAVYKTRLLGELVRAVGVLGAAGVEPVVLKGVALWLGHYPKDAVRHTVDLDLLVAPGELERARAALCSAGYVLAPHAHAPTPDGRTYAEASSARPHAAAPLKGPSGANVDLHFRLPTSGFAARGGFHGLRARAVAVPHQGVTVRCAGPEDLALHLCEHFALQNFAEPSQVPRLLSDLRALYPAGPPWRALLAGPVRQRAAVALVRRLYEAVFEAGARRRPLDGLWQRLALSEPAVAAAPRVLSRLWGHTRRVTDDLYYRPGYALRSWVPSRIYMAQRYGVDPRSPRIYPLYVRRLWSAAARTWGPRDEDSTAV